MSILITGSTGKIGSLVVSKLAGKGVQVRAMTRSPEKASFPAGVEAVKGDLLDTASVRKALKDLVESNGLEYFGIGRNTRGSRASPE